MWDAAFIDYSSVAVGTDQCVADSALLRSGQQNTAEDQTDEIARIVRDEVEAETEVLADQLRVMQGEVTRTTSASARDMGTLLAESQRQSQEAATARLDAIDRAGAARQRAANDALLAQLQVLETRLKIWKTPTPTGWTACGQPCCRAWQTSGPTITKAG